MINKVDGLGADAGSTIYLDSSCMPECVPMEKVAYVADVSVGLAKTQQGFVTFKLKDVNARVVIARLFNVEDFMFSGVKAAQFKGKPVKFKFVAQEFNGSISLVIDSKKGIEVWDGEFDYERFVGRIQFNLDTYSECGKRIFGDEWCVPSVYNTVSLNEIGQGRIGAYPKVCSMALATILQYRELDGVELWELVKVFLLTAEIYCRCMKASQNLGQLQALKMQEDYEYVQNAVSVYGDCRYVLGDCCRALLGLSKPGHLYSHLIKHAIDDAVFALNASIANNVTPMGAFVSIRGEEILKY